MAKPVNQPAAIYVVVEGLWHRIRIERRSARLRLQDCGLVESEVQAAIDIDGYRLDPPNEKQAHGCVHSA